jgi:cytochrome c oxidase assembly factor CtaG
MRSPGIRNDSPDLASRCRPGALVAGIFVVWVVIGSPLSTLDHALLTFHMVQHLLLMTIAAPLILLGTSPAVRRIGRSIAHPVSCWLAGTAVVVAWHVPAAHALGMSSPGWHLVQQVTFLAGGLLFWWPIVNPGSISGKWDRSFAPVYLFLATLPCDALSAFLAFCGRVVYPAHRSGHAHFGLSPLQDQELAGALMWFWVTIAYLIPAVVITIRMLSPSSRRVGPPVRLQLERGIDGPVRRRLDTDLET